MVALPFTSGREQRGQRPAIVIQHTTYGQGSPLVLVVPVTSQLSALRFPATVRIDPSPANGLSRPSIALIFQTRAVDRTRFTRLLGTLQPRDLHRVLEDLSGLTGQRRQ